MKKVVRVVSLLMLTLCLGLALTACAKEEGTYEYSNEYVSISVVLKDGKFTQTMTYPGREEAETFTGTYKIKGDKITITTDGSSQSVEATIKAGKYIEYPSGEGETIKLEYKK